MFTINDSASFPEKNRHSNYNINIHIVEWSYDTATPNHLLNVLQWRRTLVQKFIQEFKDTFRISSKSIRVYPWESSMDSIENSSKGSSDEASWIFFKNFFRNTYKDFCLNASKNPAKILLVCSRDISTYSTRYSLTNSARDFHSNFSMNNY